MYNDRAKNIQSKNNNYWKDNLMSDIKLVNLTVHKNTKEKRRRKAISQDCINYIKDNRDADGIAIIAFKQLDDGMVIAKFYRAIDDKMVASIPYMVHTAFTTLIK